MPTHENCCHNNVEAHCVHAHLIRGLKGEILKAELCLETDLFDVARLVQMH